MCANKPEGIVLCNGFNTTFEKMEIKNTIEQNGYILVLELLIIFVMELSSLYRLF